MTNMHSKTDTNLRFDKTSGFLV